MAHLYCAKRPLPSFLAGNPRDSAAAYAASQVLRLVDAGSAALAAAAAGPPRVNADAAASGGDSSGGDSSGDSGGGCADGGVYSSWAGNVPEALDPAAARLFLRLQQAAARVELMFPPGRRVLGPPGRLLGRAMAGLPPSDAVALAAAWHARGGSFGRSSAAGLLAALDAQKPGADRSFERAARELCAILAACAERDRLPLRYIDPLMAGLVAPVKRSIEMRRAVPPAAKRSKRTAKKQQKKAGAAFATASAAALDRHALPPALVDELLAALTGSPARCRTWRAAPEAAKLVQELVRWQLLVLREPGEQQHLRQDSAVRAVHAMWQAGVPCSWQQVTEKPTMACMERLQRAPTDAQGLRSVALAAGALTAFSACDPEAVRAVVNAISAAQEARIEMEPWVSRAAAVPSGSKSHSNATRPTEPSASLS